MQGRAAPHVQPEVLAEFLLPWRRQVTVQITQVRSPVTSLMLVAITHPLPGLHQAPALVVVPRPRLA